MSTFLVWVFSCFRNVIVPAICVTWSIPTTKKQERKRRISILLLTCLRDRKKDWNTQTMRNLVSLVIFSGHTKHDGTLEFWFELSKPVKKKQAVWDSKQWHHELSKDSHKTVLCILANMDTKGLFTPRLAALLRPMRVALSTAHWKTIPVVVLSRLYRTWVFHRSKPWCEKALIDPGFILTRKWDSVFSRVWFLHESACLLRTLFRSLSTTTEEKVNHCQVDSDSACLSLSIYQPGFCKKRMVKSGDITSSLSEVGSMLSLTRALTIVEAAAIHAEVMDGIKIRFTSGMRVPCPLRRWQQGRHDDSYWPVCL